MAFPLLIGTAAAVAFYSDLKGNADLAETLKISNFQVYGGSDSYDDNMIGIIFYRYDNLVFPCTTFSKGDVILFKSSNLKKDPNSPITSHQCALQKMCEFSNAMSPDRIVASGFAIQRGVLKFNSTTLNETRWQKYGSTNGDRVLNETEQRWLIDLLNQRFKKNLPHD